MTTFNRSDLIGETIESILAQDYTDWELIIVDDGSTDDTAKTIGRYPDPRIIYKYFEKIGYGIRLRATGIKLARGEWIAFADSDDCWAGNKLFKQVEALEQNPSADFCLTGGYNFIRKNEPLEYFYPGKTGIFCGDLFLAMFRSEVSLFPQTLLFKRNCLPAIYSHAERSPGADIGFLTGLASEHTGAVIYDPLLYRRIHSQNFSAREWKHGYEEGLAMARQFKINGKLRSQDARRFLFKLHINYGEKCRIKKLPGDSLLQFAKAWRYRPFSIVPAKKMGKLLLSCLH